MTGTLCMVRLVQGALGGASAVDLLNGPAHALIAAHPEFTFRGRKPSRNPSGYIVHTLRTVFEAFFDTDTFEDCLVQAVNRGGDADTTGAIAGMLAGAYYGLEAIPKRWLKQLDADASGRCREQAVQLVRLAQSPERCNA